MLIKVETKRKNQPISLAELRQDFDRAAIAEALADQKGVKAYAAAQLGMSREGLYRLMDRLSMNETNR